MYCFPFENFCCRDVGSFYLVVGWIISCMQMAVWDSWNVFKFFILIEIFGNSTIFQHFDTSIIALKRWNFPDNLDFKGKIVAKFLLRRQFLSTCNKATKINHSAIQRVCHLHNGILNSINLCHILSILLYHLPCVIH